MKVEFVDLKRQYHNIKEKVDKAIEKVVLGASFLGGPEVQAFEESFASYLGVQHCIACASGTDALEILLAAMGVGPEDEVIVPSHSWISTSAAVSSLGAIPVFVDTLPLRYTIDPAKIEEAITSRTKAIIPVHLYGLPAEMDEIMAIAKIHNLLILEDCAQAHGAAYKGKKTGTFGNAAAFSFYPTKNLGAFGDAGGMVTNDAEIAEKARMIADYGQKGKNQHIMEGRNSHMDAIQAAVLNVKLPHLDCWNELRRQHARLYSELLKNLPLKLPDHPEYSTSVHHLFVIQVEKRNTLQNLLKKKGISTGIHYSLMLPELPPYKAKNRKVQFPVSVGYQDKILSLPMFPELKDEEIANVAFMVKGFYGNA